jgi:hypothetical protein
MVNCTIVLAGELGGRFSDAVEGMVLTAADGRTTLVGELTDQSQVQGVLHQLFDLGLEVISFSTTADGSDGGSSETEQKERHER